MPTMLGRLERLRQHCMPVMNRNRVEIVIQSIMSLFNVKISGRVMVLMPLLSVDQHSLGNKIGAKHNEVV